MNLLSKKALVNGGSRGIGRAIACRLAREGADVVITYRESVDGARETAQEIASLGRKCLAIRADSTNSDQVSRAVAEAVSFLGRIDILVNNAGVSRRGSLLDACEDDWDCVMRTNVKGAFLYSQAVAKHMILGKCAGVIINISSRAGLKPTLTNPVHYSCSKAAVEMLTKQMALELARYGIRVNSVAPGMIETDMTRERLSSPPDRKVVVDLIPLKMIGKPEDVAAAVAFLASSEASMATGLTLVLDAGANLL